MRSRTARTMPIHGRAYSMWVRASRAARSNPDTPAEPAVAPAEQPPEVDDRARCRSCGEPTMYPNFRGDCRECANELYGDNE